jgi:hypothetical protein
VPDGCRRFLIRGGIKAAFWIILAALGVAVTLMSSAEMARAQFNMPDQKNSRPHSSSGGTDAPISVSCSQQDTLVGAGNFTASSNNNAGSFTTPNTDTDMDNCTVTFSTPALAARTCNWSVKNADASAVMAGVPDASTSTTAKVDFAPSGSNDAGGPLTITYICP